MQGTVKAFDAETRSGSVLLDDGTELPSTRTRSRPAACGGCGSGSG